MDLNRGTGIANRRKKKFTGVDASLKSRPLFFQNPNQYTSLRRDANDVLWSPSYLDESRFFFLWYYMLRSTYPDGCDHARDRSSIEGASRLLSCRVEPWGKKTQRNENPMDGCGDFGSGHQTRPTTFLLTNYIN